MIIRQFILFIGLWTVTVTCALGGESIISDVELDIKVLKKSVESLDDAEKLTKRLDRFLDRYTKAADTEKKDKAVADLNDFKVDLVKIEAFPDAWRSTLAKALKIKDEYITDTYPTKEEVQALVEKEKSKLLEKHFPLALRAKLEKEAIARFPTTAEGDMVTISVNGRAISGRVNNLSEVSAMIGSTTVPVSDLPPSFHVRRMLKNRQDYVRENYTEKRQAYLKSLLEKLPPHTYRKSGYLHYKGEWVPVIQVTKTIEDRIEELKAKGIEEEERKQALFGKIKTYGIMAACGLGVLLVLGLIVAVKARKKG